MPKAVNNPSKFKEVYEEAQTLKMLQKSPIENIAQYLSEKGEPKEYDLEELKEKYLMIDWIACQLCMGRPIKTKQIFLYGEPSTQKTLLLNLLAKVINIYFASARRNDFAGAHDHYELWLFDEFHEPSESSGLFGATEDIFKHNSKSIGRAGM